MNVGSERSLDAYLVATARLGDRTAMRRLVAIRNPRLMAHARRQGCDPESARDAVQEAWIEILRGLHGLRDDHAFLPWAMRIVTRRVARHIRGRAARRRLEQAVATENAGTATVQQGAEAHPDMAGLRRAIAGLPDGQAAALSLFYLEEMSVAEVAVALDIPPGTVKSRLAHARARLRAILEGDGYGPDRQDDRRGSERRGSRTSGKHG